MKFILVSLIALSSLTAFSQVIDPVELDFSSVQEAMSKLTKDHSESAGVNEIKQEVESKYGVKCEGNSSASFPDATKQVKYVADCKGGSQLKLTIKSKFQSSKPGIEFSVKSYEVEL